MDERQQGAKLWLGVLAELRTRRVKDILLVCIDGSKGFPQPIDTIDTLARDRPKEQSGPVL